MPHLHALTWLAMPAVLAILLVPASSGPAVPYTIHGAHDVVAHAAILAQADGTIESVAVCTNHNATMWHPLVKRDAAGAIICTYTHEHHDDPKELNDLFGAPSAWYDGNTRD